MGEGRKFRSRFSPHSQTSICSRLRWTSCDFFKISGDMNVLDAETLKARRLPRDLCACDSRVKLTWKTTDVISIYAVGHPSKYKIDHGSLKTKNLLCVKLSWNNFPKFQNEIRHIKTHVCVCVKSFFYISQIKWDPWKDLLFEKFIWK